MKHSSAHTLAKKSSGMPIILEQGVAERTGAVFYPKEENGKLDEEPQMKQVQGHGSLDGHDFDSP
jgi:hypothetical protein